MQQRYLQPLIFHMIFCFGPLFLASGLTVSKSLVETVSKGSGGDSTLEQDLHGASLPSSHKKPFCYQKLLLLLPALCRVVGAPFQQNQVFSFAAGSTRHISISSVPAMSPRAPLGQGLKPGGKCGSHFLSMVEKEGWMREVCLVAQGKAGGKTAVSTLTHRGVVCLC